MTENQLEEMQLTEDVAEHVEINCPETPDSTRFVAQPVEDFLFSWIKGSVENQIKSKRMRGYLRPKLQPANHQDNHQRWR